MSNLMRVLLNKDTNGVFNKNKIDLFIKNMFFFS